MTVPDFTPTPLSTNGVPDFTPESKVKFTLYGEMYVGIAELTLDDTFNYEKLSTEFSDKSRTNEQRVESMKQVIRTLLEPDSADRLIGHLTNRQQPVGMTTVVNIFKYIMTEYGDRPTTPGSDSSAGSDNPESGTPSTESSSLVASTS